MVSDSSRLAHYWLFNSNRKKKAFSPKWPPKNPGADYNWANLGHLSTPICGQGWMGLGIEADWPRSRLCHGV